jgi:hypothetical protein
VCDVIVGLIDAVDFLNYFHQRALNFIPEKVEVMMNEKYWKKTRS